MNIFMFSAIILIIVLFNFILIPIVRKKFKVLIILAFNSLINNFIEQYNDYKTIISMNLNRDELKNFIRIEFSNEYECYYPIRIQLFLSKKYVLVHTSLELRNLLRLYGEELLNYQDYLEERYKVKFNINTKSYSTFLHVMVNLRTLCIEDVPNSQNN